VDPLPEDLQACQNKIDNYRKEQALLNQIGKFYHTEKYYNNNNLTLRRVYRDKNDNIRVDEFKYNESNGWVDKSREMEFKTWVITEAMNLQEFTEASSPQYWYQDLERMLNIPQIKDVFIKPKVKVEHA